MSIFTDFVCKKINEVSGLTPTQKNVLATEYRNGNIPLSELLRARKSKKE